LKRLLALLAVAATLVAPASAFALTGFAGGQMSLYTGSNYCIPSDNCRIYLYNGGGWATETNVTDSQGHWGWVAAPVGLVAVYGQKVVNLNCYYSSATDTRTVYNGSTTVWPDMTINVAHGVGCSLAPYRF